MDILNKMMAWEDGILNEEKELELFQELVNSGLAWELQGCYGRYATMLLINGSIEEAKNDGIN